MTGFLKANYHTHTYRCQHAYGSEREYIEAAIRMGIAELGFSDHVPCPFKDGYVSGIRMTMEQAPEYVYAIRELGKEYASDIKLYVGFEAEYIPEFFKEQKAMFDRLGCDYMIMGQHFMKSEQTGPYTGTPTDDESRIREYVDTVIEGMKTGMYSYLAHPVLINYQGLDSDYIKCLFIAFHITYIVHCMCIKPKYHFVADVMRYTPEALCRIVLSCTDTKHVYLKRYVKLLKCLAHPRHLPFVDRIKSLIIY